MPPLGTFSEAEIQLLNDPTRSVKRAQLATLCRKASLKVKGTNEQLIAALNAAAQNKIADRENIDPMATIEKTTDNPFYSKSVSSEDDQYESSFETVIYHSKENENWSQSTPATVPRGRKSSGRRKSTKPKAARTTGMYPELSLYPDISTVGGDMPTTTTEDFSKVADGILEEMNSRLTAKQQTTVVPLGSPAPEPIFRDVMIPLKESPFLTNTNSKHRFSDVHNKIFTKMDSVETHYAAQREFSNSPEAVRSPLRIPKRPIATVEANEPSPKRMRSGVDIEEKSRFFEGRREESLSEQGRDIQNMMRQELQKRLQKKLGTTTESDDSIELELHHMPGKTDLDSGGKLTFGKSIPKITVKDKVIPVKSASQYSLNEMADDSPSLSDSRAAIKAPSLSSEVPSIVLVPGAEPVLPKDKKIPTKHQQPKASSRALVIPAAKSTKRTATTKVVKTRPAPTPTSPSKMQLSPFKSANFTMGAVPDNPKPGPRRKSQRVAAKSVIPRPSPTKPRAIRSVSSTRAATQRALTIRSVPAEITEVQVPVRFDGGKGKRKHMDTVETSPTKRVKLNGGTSFTTARKAAGLTYSTPSTSLVRYDANSVMFTPGAVSSRTASKGYGNGRSAPRRPPWR